MSRRRGAGIVPAIGWSLPVFVLATGLSTAWADELSDLRANQELLQRRIDQLAQVPPPAPPPGGPGGPVTAGSFPRSFVIPGTEVSLRVGGQGSVNGYIPRFRQGYATLGGLLMGQTQGTFTDNDSDPELLDFGGTTASLFVSRTPQVRYTYPLPYGMSVAVSAENPSPNFAGPFGTFFTDTNQIPNMAACSPLTTPAIGGATGTATIGGTTVASNITNACLGNAAFFNPSQDLAPNFVGRWRIEQPWGHIQAGVQTILYTLNDGMFLNKQYLGYGGALSGNFFTWGKDNLTWSAAAGDGLGDGVSNNIGVATNFGGRLGGQAVNATDSRSFFSTNRALYDSLVRATTITSWGAKIGYQHWWTPTLRSTIDFSINHSDVPGSLTQAAPGGSTGAAASNKELSLSHANLIWSPVAFVDIGVEGAWGHRVVVSNVKGDAWTLDRKST